MSAGTCDDGLRGQPGVVETALAFVSAPPRHRAQHAPAVPIKGCTAKGIRLQAREEVEREQGKTDPALPKPDAPAPQTDGAGNEDIAKQWPPQPLDQQPQGCQQRGRPRKSILDKNEGLRPIDAIGRWVGWLVDGECRHVGLWGWCGAVVGGVRKVF
jgi:hypothetical protein